MDFDLRALPGGSFGIGVVLGNRCASTARSSATMALHLSRWLGAALSPAFTAVTRRSRYDKDGAAACAERQGCPRPGRGGRQAPDPVAAACDRRNTSEQAWTARTTAARHGGAPGLVVSARRGRAVSRHRWAGASYVPAASAS